MKQFTGNTDFFGQPATYNDAYSLTTNYSIKNTIYNDSNGDQIIPITGMNPLSWPVVKQYTQNPEAYFFTKVITNFNMIPRMNNV